MAIVLGTADSDWLNGDVSSDELYGLDGDDRLSGMDGDDLLDGGTGADILDGGTGADVMVGGVGSDQYWVDDAGDLVIEQAGDWGHDTVIVTVTHYVLPAGVEDLEVYTASGVTAVGNALANSITGWWGNDWLEGGAGNDYLFGRSGSDTLVGGSGDDYYLIANEDDGEFDTIVELAGGGTDTVEVAASHYVMHAYVENVVAYDNFSPKTIVGNASNNHLLIGNGAVSFDGAGGIDTVDYRESNGAVLVDLLTGANGGKAADDLLVSVENVTGGSYDDVLRGTAGANVLNGFSGADIMEGRGGNDTYYVDHWDDMVIEAAGEGTDEVRHMTGGVYALPAEVERLRNLSDFLIADGNALNNDMIGAGGFDHFRGGDGHDNLSGGGGDDLLYGEEGHDVLNGGTGADLLDGGAGNDAYIVDSDADQVVEAADGGVDTVYASTAAYILPDAVESLSFNGSGAFQGTGNALANVIHGGSGGDHLSGLAGDDELRSNGGADLLEGGDGNDLLVGGGGADVLRGGAGADRFRIGSYESGLGAEADWIDGFAPGEDVIDLQAIDADLWTSGNQAFAFIGGAAFSGVAGELRVAFDGTDTWVQADVNGDGAADFDIRITGQVLLAASDFVL